MKADGLCISGDIYLKPSAEEVGASQAIQSW
jgi:hypothetical protein